MVQSHFPKRCSSTAILTVFILIAPHASFGEESESKQDATQELFEAAKKTYKLLLSDYRAGKITGPTQLELLNRWSQRIWLVQSNALAALGASRAQAIVKSQDEHGKRMRELEGVVRALAAEGKATTAEVTAARFFSLESDNLREQMSQLNHQSEDRELKIELPAASEAVPLIAKQKTINLTISREGKYSIIGKTLDLAELRATLRQLSSDGPSTQILIRCHPDTPTRFFFAAINECRAARLEYSAATIDSK